MKKSTILILLSWTVFVHAQTIIHHAYTVYYNASIKEADSVSWDLTPAMVGCQHGPRKNVFSKDGLIQYGPIPADYTRSGYDRGHLFNYEDAVCDSIDRIECFYMTNMFPQIHAFNAGDWKVLEIQERAWAKIQKLHIIAGGIGSIGLLNAGENIPAYFFKAILMNGHYTCWIMPNSKYSHTHDVNYWQVSSAELDSKTGLKL